MVEWKDVVGKWILIREKYNPRAKIREVKVVRLSPSGRYARIREEGWVAPEEWIDIEDYVILEVLG